MSKIAGSSAGALKWVLIGCGVVAVVLIALSASGIID